MALINKALLHPKEFNVDELKLQFDKEDEEIEQKKQEWAEVRKKMATERRYEKINGKQTFRRNFCFFKTLLIICRFIFLHTHTLTTQGTIERIEKA